MNLTFEDVTGVAGCTAYLAVFALALYAVCVITGATSFSRRGFIVWGCFVAGVVLGWAYLAVRKAMGSFIISFPPEFPLSGGLLGAGLGWLLTRPAKGMPRVPPASDLRKWAGPEAAAPPPSGEAVTPAPHKITPAE